jgi:perosamine synthetase
LGEEEKRAVSKVLDSLQIAQGEKAAAFEKSLCAFTGRRYGIAVSSGTSGLVLSLLALGIQKGDRVICPSFNCVALLHALQAVGAQPVLADIDLEDFNISVSDVKKKIQKKTKALIIPHAFGRAARIQELLKLDIPVIEDGTQALGASVGTKKVGGFGELSVFSFYATKMITTGEGGMILTDNFRLAEQIRDLRDYDKKENYRFRMNAKMTDLEAAMGIEQLKKLPFFIQRRREIAKRYSEAFRRSDVILPVGDWERDHVYYRYVVRIPKKSKEWIERFQERGIDAKRPIFKPLHQYLGLPDKLFPLTSEAVKETCSLPIFPSLLDKQCAKISRCIREHENSMCEKSLAAAY